MKKFLALLLCLLMIVTCFAEDDAVFHHAKMQIRLHIDNQIGHKNLAGYPVNPHQTQSQIKDGVLLDNAGFEPVKDILDRPFLLKRGTVFNHEQSYDATGGNDDAEYEEKDLIADCLYEYTESASHD